MFRRTLAIGLAALAATPLAAGCGGGEDRLPDDVQVRRTLDTFGRSIRSADYTTICKKLLAKRVVDRLKRVGLPCEQAVARGFGQVREPKITVGKITVSDDTASARVKTEAQGQRPSEDTMLLVRQDDDWRISDLAGS